MMAKKRAGTELAVSAAAAAARFPADSGCFRKVPARFPATVAGVRWVSAMMIGVLVGFGR